MSRSDRTLDAALARFSETASLQRLVAQYTRQFRMPPAEVADAIQDAFCKMLKAYAGKPVQSPEALLHRVICNELITVLRRNAVVTLVELDEDYVALAGSSRRTSDADDDDGPERELVYRTDDADREESDPEPRRRQVSVRQSPDEAAQQLENMMVETLDAAGLVREVLKELDGKYRDVVVKLLDQWEPNELREAFGQDPYRLQVWARVKVCRILARFAAAGNELAERLHVRGGCARILKSQGAAA